MLLMIKKRTKIVSYILPGLGIEIEKLAKRKRWTLDELVEEALVVFIRVEKAYGKK